MEGTQRGDGSEGSDGKDGLGGRDKEDGSDGGEGRDVGDGLKGLARLFVDLLRQSYKESQEKAEREQQLAKARAMEARAKWRMASPSLIFSDVGRDINRNIQSAVAIWSDGVSFWRGQFEDATPDFDPDSRLSEAEVDRYVESYPASNCWHVGGYTSGFGGALRLLDERVQRLEILAQTIDPPGLAQIIDQFVLEPVRLRRYIGGN
jgi:hypothetical protein